MAESTLDRKLRERKEAEAAAAAQKAAEEAAFAEFIPDDKSERSEEDVEMDRVMDHIDIILAYKKWCGKSSPNPYKGQRESIKVRCPWPEHTDDHPSASLNLDKDVFMCHGTCDRGGDKYDLAAIRFGYPIPGYKTGEMFHKLRREMAESLGYNFHRVPGKKEYAIEAPAQINEAPDPGEETGTDAHEQGWAPDEAVGDVAEGDGTSTAGSSASPLASVSPLLGDEDETEDDYFYKQAILVDYEKFIKPDTFLDKWMSCTRIDDAPEDYHFWHGMIALGLAVGRDVWLADDKGNVYSNLNICLLGPTGVGKSRSKRHLDQLFTGTNSYFNPSDEPPRGIKQIGGAGSGEVLVKQFEHYWSPDPTNPKAVEPAPVRGLIEFSEFSQLININSRRGSTIENTIMDIYDCKRLISSMSLTTGEKKARDPFGSLLTTTQPKMLKRLINQAALDSGFANRFIFATGLPKETVEFGGVIADVSPTFSLYAAIKMWSRTNGDDGISIQLTDDAKAYGNEYWRENIKPIEKQDSHLLKRIGLTMKKMLLLTAINERCEGVTPEMMERTFSILPYLIRSTGVSSNHLGETKEGEIIRAIREAAARHEKDNPGKGITLREIRRMYQSKKFEISDVNKALDAMCKLGELEKLEAQKGPGRPTIRYRMAQ